MPLNFETGRFGTLLSQTARQWRRAVDQRLQPFGLTEATWLPLIRVARAKTAMRQKDLAASLSLDGSSVVRLLDSLEKANLIERRPPRQGNFSDQAGQDRCRAGRESGAPGSRRSARRAD